jgi:hypothetical protein
LTYLFFTAENTLELAHPWLLGQTISALIAGGTSMLWVFVGFTCLRTALGVLRRRCDTRTFLGIYGTLATQVVIGQRRLDVPSTRIAARAALSREVTDFLERDVPVAFATLFGLVGSIIMLSTYDGVLTIFALFLGLAGAGLNVLCSRRTKRLNCDLNNVFEQEVDVISGGCDRATRQHFTRIARQEIRVSDWEAATFSATQLIVLSLLALALLRASSWSSRPAGDVYAIFRYVTLFTGAIGGLPILASRLSRLRDIHQRLLANQTSSEFDGP